MRKKRIVKPPTRQPIPLHRQDEERKLDIKPYDYFNKQVDEEEDDDLEIEKRPMYNKPYNAEVKALSEKLDRIDAEDRKLEKVMKRE
jgi:hypothetical protein